MDNTTDITKKPIAEEIKEDSYLFGFQKDSEGNEKFMRFSTEKVIELSTEKAEEAAKRAEEAAENAEFIKDIILSECDTFEVMSKVVKSGKARNFYPVGTQLNINHSKYGKMIYEVVAHDHFKVPDDPLAHTMTILCKGLLDSRPFDTREAFYCADTELAENTTYEFTLPKAQGNWKAGRYSFSTPEYPLPAGTQFFIYSDGDANAPLEELQIVCYASPYDTSPICGFNFTYEPSVSGISLGSVGEGRFNHYARVLYGSSNYVESDIRKYIDSDAEENYWTPSTMFDRIPENAAESGFIAGLDEDLRAVIGEVMLPCCANGSYEAPDSITEKGNKYSIAAKVFLLSPNELGLSDKNDYSDSTTLDFYADATTIDRIKYVNEETAGTYFTRCSERYYPANTMHITTSGVISKKAAISPLRFSPAFNIV